MIGEKPRGSGLGRWRLAAASLGTIVISMHQRCTSGALWDDARPCVGTYTSHLCRVGVCRGYVRVRGVAAHTNETKVQSLRNLLSIETITH